MKIFETKIEGVTFEVILPDNVEYTHFKCIISGEWFIFHNKHLARILKVLANSQCCEDVIEGVKPCCLIKSRGMRMIYSNDFYEIENLLLGWM